MTKKDFVKNVSLKVGFSQKDVATVIDATFDVIKDAMASGDSVSVHGFAKFGVADVAERTVRSPQTGEAITVPAHKRAKISVSPILKDAVR